MAPLIRPKMLLIGSPGSGKSFYGKMISHEWDIPFRSMGNELRARMTPELKERMGQVHVHHHCYHTHTHTSRASSPRPAQSWTSTRA